MVRTDAVSAAILHPYGSVLATCSGQRHIFPRASQDGSDDDNEDSSRSSWGSPTSDSSPLIPASSPLKSRSDNSLKIWAL